MRRRDFIAGLGGAAAWPVVALAQQPAMPIIGYLSAGSPARSPATRILAIVAQGLNDLGYVDGKNVEIDFRSAEGHFDRLPELAAALVRRNVAVIVATGGTPTALAAKAATSTIPIVFSVGADPVRLGLVASLSHPGGNATGTAILTSDLTAKRIGLLAELVPGAARIAALIHPGTPDSEQQRDDAKASAGVVGREVLLVDVAETSDFESAFAAMSKAGVRALLVTADPFLAINSSQIIALAARHRLPAMYEFREFAEQGGFVSYGPNRTATYRELGVYAGRILKGEKPANLPVQQAIKFEFVFNLKTARAFGFDISPTLLARADEVIE